MSDLDKAIRARLQLVRVHMGEHRNAQFDDGVDPLFNDAGELGAAVVAVLDLHAPQALYPLVPDDVRCAGCSNHVVRVDYPCATVLAIADSLGVSGEDRSEPTPAPREPRMWRHGVHTDIDADVNDVAGTTTGRHWQRMPGKEFVWTSAGLTYSAGTVLYVENEVSEVVTPEGTP